MDDENKKGCSDEGIILEIGEDIILEILSRVTRVESLLRLRCVSKSWRCLIDSKFFINRHLQHATRSRGNFIDLYAVVGCYLDNPTTSVSWNNIDPLNSHLMAGHILCHCNGMLLVLVLNAQEQVLLSNPSLRVFIRLPDLGYSRITKCGVGWDQHSDVYKVFVTGFCNSQRMGHVYSTKAKSWRPIEGGYGCISYNGTGAYAGGRIHWLVRSRGRVCMEWWEVRSEVFGRIDLPVEEGVGRWRSSLWLWERAGCIHLVIDSHDFTTRIIWALDEKTCSWLERPNLPTTIKGHQRRAFSIIPTLVKP